MGTEFFCEKNSLSLYCHFLLTMSDYPPTGLSASVKKLPEWIQKGCGNEEYYCEEKNATFLGERMPEKLPDLSKHTNFLTDVLKEKPELYEQLKDKKTKLGVTLGHCIKTGIDNPGHPMIKTCGLVAGDEECFELFADIFEPVISARHNGYARDAKHPTDLDVSKLSNTKIDPTGNYVLTSRCRTGRSVRGFKLPPVTDFEERRKLETLVTKGLLSLEGELKGDYFPLHGSKSYDAKNFFVWVNEEDQMRIVSMEKGDDIKAIITRFSNGTAQIQKVLKENGADFMHSEHLGWILTCPYNLGTGLRAGAMVKVPKFSAREDFKAVCKKMGLQCRGTAGVDSASTGGTWDISNADRLGKSEVQLVNIFIEGVAQIIKWEQALEKGEDIEAEVAKASLPEKY